MPAKLGSKPLSPEELNNRRVFVMQCRIKAWSFYRIADAVEEKFGYPISAAQCSVDFKHVMRERAKEQAEETDAVRNTMVAQIDEVLEKHLELAIAGDVDSADIVLKAMVRKARITGIDAPLKSERKDTTKTPRLTEFQIMEKMKAIMDKLGIQRSIPGPLVDGTIVPAKLSEANIAVLPDREAESEREPAGGDEPVDDDPVLS